MSRRFVVHDVAGHRFRYGHGRYAVDEPNPDGKGGKLIPTVDGVPQIEWCRCTDKRKAERIAAALNRSVSPVVLQSDPIPEIPDPKEVPEWPQPSPSPTPTSVSESPSSSSSTSSPTRR